MVAQNQSSYYRVPYPTTNKGRYENGWKFNGKELDDATGMYYYGARYMDPRLSIFISVDPATEEYRDINPYAYVANNPVNAIDPDGKRIIYIIRGKEGQKSSQYTYRNGNFYDKNNRIFIPNEKKQATMYIVWKSYQKIENSNNDILKGQLRQLETSSKNHFVEQSPNGKNAVLALEDINVINGRSSSTQTEFSFGSDFNDAFETVIHEMRHQFDYDIGNMEDNKLRSTADDPAEIRAVFNENIAKEMNGNKPRTTYGKIEINPEKLKDPPNNIQCDDL